MSRLLRSELLKLAGSRWAWGTCVAVLVGVIGVTALQLGFETDPADGSLRWGAAAERFSTPDELAGLLDVAPLLGLVALVVGAVALPTEFRYGTITPAFLAVPSPWRILGAKALVTGASAALLTVAAQLAVLALAAAWLGAAGAGLPFGAETVRVLVLSPLAVAAGALIGVGVGAAVRQQVAAVIAVVAWAVAVEQVLAGFVAGLRPALPFTGGILSLAAGGSDDLGAWGAAGVCAAYVALALGAGAVLLERRDLA